MGSELEAEVCGSCVVDVATPVSDSQVLFWDSCQTIAFKPQGMHCSGNDAHSGYLIHCFWLTF